MKTRLPQTLALAFLFFLVAAPASEPPNIVFILADDLGYGDVSANNPDAGFPTPAMDRLAREGMRFTDAHSPSAVCTPTRYGVLTGRYCWRTRLKRGVLWGIDRSLIEPNRVTMASFLKAKGYATACIGKWHLGVDITDDDGKILRNKREYATTPGTDPVNYSRPVGNDPTAYGFDTGYIIIGSLNMYPYTYVHDDHFTEAASEFFPRTPHNISIISGGPKAPGFDFEKVVDVFNEQAAAFIRKEAQTDNPFFLYLPLTAPHKPVLPTPDFKDKSGHGIYGDFVQQVDDVVARIDRVLEATGAKSNTLVVVTSDNGSFMLRIPEDKPDHLDDFKVVGYHEKTHRSNHIWRGTKADIYEGGHRVPLLVRWPGTIKPGSTSDETTTLTDWFATFAELTGHDLAETEGEDSFSLLPVLRGTADDWKRAPAIHHSSGGMFAIRDGKWKLIAGNGSGGRQGPKGKPFGRPFQLYDLEADLSETNNLIETHPEVATRLETALKKIRDDGRSR